MSVHHGWYGVFYDRHDGEKPWLMAVYSSRRDADRRVVKEIKELQEGQEGDWAHLVIKRVKVQTA